MGARYLALDGGGTKTRAVVVDANGIVLGTGVGGTGNILSAGTEAVLSSAYEAITLALRDANDPGDALQAIWAGFAGVSPSSSNEVIRALSQKYGVAEELITVTVDGMLLAAQLYVRPDTSHGIALIAGTGSLALAFRRQEKYGPNSVLCRSGGYGALLGDEGSGYYLGRRALKSILSKNESVLHSEIKGEHVPGFNPWQLEILDLLQIKERPNVALHTLMLQKLNKYGSAGTRTHIASFTRALFDHYEDPAAKAIIVESAEELAKSVKALCRPVGPIDPTSSVLLLTGSLLHVQQYQRLILGALKSLNFKYVDGIEDPAQCAAIGLATNGHLKTSH